MRSRRGKKDDTDVNLLAHELSEMSEAREAGGARGIRETWEAHEEERKRRLEEEADEDADDAELNDGDQHKRYRAFRRELIRKFWGESPEPPPLPRREVPSSPLPFAWWAKGE